MPLPMRLFVQAWLARLSPPCTALARPSRLAAALALVLLLVGGAAGARAQSFYPESFVWLPVLQHYSRSPALTGWMRLNMLDIQGRVVAGTPTEGAPRQGMLSYSTAFQSINSAVGTWVKHRHAEPFYRTQIGGAYRVYFALRNGHIINLAAGLTHHHLQLDSDWLKQQAPNEPAPPDGEYSTSYQTYNLGAWYNYGSFHLGFAWRNLTPAEPDGIVAAAPPDPVYHEFEATTAYYFLTILRTQLVPIAKFYKYEHQPINYGFGGMGIFDNWLMAGFEWQPNAWQWQLGVLVRGTARFTYQLELPLRQPARSDNLAVHTLNLQLNF